MKNSEMCTILATLWNECRLRYYIASVPGKPSFWLKMNIYHFAIYNRSAIKSHGSFYWKSVLLQGGLLVVWNLLWLSSTVADLRGPSRLRPPFGRRTDAVTVLLISENSSVGLLWRRHLQLTDTQVTATHQSLSLSVFGGTLNLAQSVSLFKHD